MSTWLYMLMTANFCNHKEKCFENRKKGLLKRETSLEAGARLRGGLGHHTDTMAGMVQ